MVELGLQLGLPMSTPASALQIHTEVAQNLCGPGTRRMVAGKACTYSMTATHTGAGGGPKRTQKHPSSPPLIHPIAVNAE